jgi:arylsulfatase A-like enzyme
MFMTDENQGIRPDETTIAEVLKERAGYSTALIGKWHLGHDDEKFLPTQHGFDHFIGHTGGCIDYFTMTYGDIPDWYHDQKLVQQDGYATDVITTEAIKYLESRKSENNPFFLYLPYNAPHFGKGYSPADKKPVNIMQPQANDLLRVPKIEDKIRREYAAMTVSLDDGVGKVLDALDRLDLTKNTLVIFITDNGGDPVYGGSNIPFRGVKASLFEGGIRVPALMRWQDKIKPGIISDATVSTLDLFPTFCKLLKIDAGNFELDGMDISPAIFEGKDVGPRELFWELGSHEELDRKPWGALLSDQWKYVNSPVEGEFLFDLSQDPYEANDLSTTEHTKFYQLQERWSKIATECRN